MEVQHVQVKRAMHQLCGIDGPAKTHLGASTKNGVVLGHFIVPFL
jgi:hypothetical protein